MARAEWVRWGGAAAIIGGAMWVVKASIIMLGGDQPPYLFEGAPLAFALALLALGASLAGQGGSMAQAGRVVSLVVVAAAVANLLEEALTEREPVPAVSSVVDLAVGVGPIVGLVLLGWTSRSACPPRWQPGPLALAALYPLAVLLLLPAALVVDLDGPSGERLIEVPILVVGLGWTALGAGLVRESGAGRATVGHRSDPPLSRMS